MRRDEYREPAQERVAVLDGIKRKAGYSLRSPTGRLGVWLSGHREFVGVTPEEIGRLYEGARFKMRLLSTARTR